MVRSKLSRPIMVMSFLYRYMNSNGLMISVSFHHSVCVSCVNASGPTLTTGTINSFLFLSLSQKAKLKGFYRKMIYSLANLTVIHHHIPFFSDVSCVFPHVFVVSSKSRPFSSQPSLATTFAPATCSRKIYAGLGSSGGNRSNKPSKYHEIWCSR